MFLNLMVKFKFSNKNGIHILKNRICLGRILFFPWCSGLSCLTLLCRQLSCESWKLKSFSSTSFFLPLTLWVPGGGVFLTPPIVSLTPFFCAWRKYFQLLMSFLFEDFNTSQSCQIFDLLVKILKNFPTKISNLPHF